MAPVGHASAQAGLPPHKSHFCTLPVSCTEFTVPNGEAIVQTLQPTHTSSSTTFAPVAASTWIASTGHACRHHASSHWVQVYGTLRPVWWKSNTLMRDFAGLKT